MSRPSFQFYPGDWQKNANLRRCSPAARGVWMDILCLLHDSEGEYGVLRWPLKDIANAASAPMTLVRELVAKGVLKGADKGAEPYVYRPKHAGKVGDPVILVAPGDGPVWYSSRFVRDEYVRLRRGESTRFDSENQPAAKKTAKAAAGTERARLRAAVYEKTGGYCHHCKEKLDGPWEIDHFIPRAKGGSNLFSNLVPSCVPCNQDKSDSLPDDWEAASRSPNRRVGDPHGDGPSTSSSPSGSEANASAGADAPAPVDKSTDPKRIAWRDCGNWLVENGVAESGARELMGLVLRDYPAAALDAFVAAAKKGPTPDPKAYLLATAKAMAGQGKTVASDAAEHTAEYLAQTAEQKAAALSPESHEARRAAMAKLGRGDAGHSPRAAA